MSIVENFMQCSHSHTNQDKLALLIGYSCASSRFPITCRRRNCVSPKYSVWPKLSQIPKLAKSETTQTSLPFPIISRQFRAFVDKKSTPFPILNRELALLSLILLFWPSQPEELDKKTRVFYCCLQWVGGGRRRERKKKDDRRNSF